MIVSGTALATGLHEVHYPSVDWEEAIAVTVLYFITPLPAAGTLMHGQTGLKGCSRFSNCDLRPRHEPWHARADACQALDFVRWGIEI